jgi:peptide deformylase
MMALRDIVIYPEGAKILRAHSTPVGHITPGVEDVVEDLKETLAAHPEGIGLAAPQIGVTIRVVAVRLRGGDRDSAPGPPMVLINPEILEARERRRDFDGCLSLPGLYGETTRPHYLRVTGVDESGSSFDEVFRGFDAVVVHHELDHLDGVLFIDRAAGSEDLYHVRVKEDGRAVRVPLSRPRRDNDRERRSRPFSVEA